MLQHRIPDEAKTNGHGEQMIFKDTIVALSSGRLPAGVAVIRLSGPHVRFAVETISGSLSRPRVMTMGEFVDPTGRVLDRGLVVFFPGPSSVTGEDVAEFHLHGGKAVVTTFLETLTSFDNMRHAEAGEFTRRAFLNGKLDFPETEALADLISAETEAQRRFAMLNASGAQSSLYLSWRQRLIQARAMIEAEIDFADEDDVPGSISDRVWSDIRSIVQEIDTHLGGFRAAEILREGFEVVIVGAPNAGKSSLFNALARREVAIVTDEPGTTRDLLDVNLDIEDFKVRLTDTAGLRAEAGKVERIGIERAREKAREAHLVLWLEDLSNPVAIEVPQEVPFLKIGTKKDLKEGASSEAGSAYDLKISAHTGEGLSDLVAVIGNRVAAEANAECEVLPSRLRHVELLSQVKVALVRALEGNVEQPELRVEELRLASDELGRIVGTVDVEDLLDVIFSQFCIGK